MKTVSKARINADDKVKNRNRYKNMDKSNNDMEDLIYCSRLLEIRYEI